MATYGEPGKNTFAVTGVSGILSPVVNPGTKVTQIYRGAALGRFQSIGTYNSTTRKFTPDPNANLSQTEINSLSNENGTKAISNAGSTATIKGVRAAGGNADSANAEANKIFSPNSANNPDSTGDFNSTEFIEALGTDSKTRNVFNQLGPLVYPNDLGQTKQDVIQFDMLQYKPKKFASGQGQFGFGERERNFTSDSIGQVVLPIPSGISDTTAVNWGGNEMNALQASLANVALSGITEGLSAGGKAFGDELKKIQDSFPAVSTAIGALFADSAVGTTGLLTRTTGAVINPNLELLFSSPTLRPFNFRFKMSARNKNEAQTIINIIRFFRQGMAPQRTPSNIFLKSPHTFKIRYKHRGQSGEDHKYIGKIKECALQNFTVDYTPEGQYATFEDGVLVSYEINMQFTELEPIFNEDNDKNYGEIGY
jgi:hypothetical protein